MILTMFNHNKMSGNISKININMKTFVKKNTWLPGIKHGWGNGYVIIPKGHPLHGKHYDDIDVEVHGGLTFSEPVKELDWPEISKKDKSGWVIGFDTAHADDDCYSWPEQRVKSETEYLLKQLMK